jgi:hypothetical protein
MITTAGWKRSWTKSRGMLEARMSAPIEVPSTRRRMRDDIEGLSSDGVATAPL